MEIKFIKATLLFAAASACFILALGLSAGQVIALNFGLVLAMASWETMS